MPLPAGALDRRIEIISAATSRSTSGAVIQDWDHPTLVATVWAQRRDVRGAEQFEEAKFDATVVTRYRIRHRTDITPEHRVREQGTVYDIQSVTEALELGRNVATDLLTVKHTNQEDG